MLAGLDRRQRQLALSLLANIATRVPGLAGVLFFLPRLKAQIGLISFATVMAAIALGGSVTFVMNGISFVARRLVGDAASRDDRIGEADAFRGIVDMSLVGLLLCSIAIVGYCMVRGSLPVFYAGALITALAVLTQQQDAIRAAYNEHYVTAILLVAMQSVAYVIALFVLPRSAYGVMLGIGVMIGPMILASLASLAGLLYKRPYLLRGRPHLRRTIAVQGVMLGVGEGLLMASLNFVTLYLDFVGAVADSAWFATTLRLFMVVLVPVVMILTPLSSYIRLIWNDCSLARQRTIVLGTLTISIGYSLVVGVAMIVLSRVYVGGTMHIAAPGAWYQSWAIFAMFAAVVVFKSYTSIAFVVLDNRWLSLSAVAGTVLALASGLLARIWLAPIGAVATFALALTLAIVIATTFDTIRFRRNTLVSV